MKTVDLVNTHLSVEIADETKIGAARRRVEKWLKHSDFPHPFTSDVSIIVMELASNLHKFANGRKYILFRIIATDDKKGVEVISCDDGPHVRNIKLALQDGYSTSGTLGIGLGSIKRLSDDFLFFSKPRFGSSFISRKYLYNKSDSSIRHTFDWVCSPMEGLDYCGDLVVSHEQDKSITLLVADGLGHGFEASIASQKAKAYFDKHHHLSIATLIEDIHKELKDTRGVAMAIARIFPQEGTLYYGGVGNVSGNLVRVKGNNTGMVSMPGVVGYNMRKTHIQKTEILPGDVLLMHTDGLNPIRSYDIHQIKGQDATIIASNIFAKFAKKNDDTAILVYKN